MVVLRFEHSARHYDDWKSLFDSDPIHRKQMGVKRYRLYRMIDNPSHVVLEFEFDALNEAQNTLNALEQLWERTAGSVIVNPKYQLFDVVESNEL